MYIELFFICFIRYLLAPYIYMFFANAYVDTIILRMCMGRAVAQLVQLLRDKPEDRIFYSRWDQCGFSLT
jgi:hypothetical protein